MGVRSTGVVLAALLAACGGAADPRPAHIRDPGEGSGTLLVQAYVKGEATVPNANDPTEFRTRIVVRVSRRGVPLAGAAVRVNGIALADRGLGLYVEPSQLLGTPPEIVALEVSAGGDWARAACSSPGGHVFTHPSRGGEALVVGAGPVEIAWLRPSRADSASLDVGRFAATGNIDEGAFAIPPDAPGLAPASQVALGLWRENRVLLRGGATGSLLSVSMWNGLDITLAR
jgi:hypothetical protein